MVILLFIILWPEFKIPFVESKSVNEHALIEAKPGTPVIQHLQPSEQSDPEKTATLLRLKVAKPLMGGPDAEVSVPDFGKREQDDRDIGNI